MQAPYDYNYLGSEALASVLCRGAFGHRVHDYVKLGSTKVRVRGLAQVRIVEALLTLADTIR